MSVGSGTGTAISAYDITSSVGQIRLEIGDTTTNEGPRPGGGNFTDAELAYFLTQEGDSVGRAVARACEVLATQWAALADLTVGPRSERLSQVAERFESRARALRLQYGGSGGAQSVGVVRGDGYQSVTGPKASDNYESESAADVRGEYVGDYVYVLRG